MKTSTLFRNRSRWFKEILLIILFIPFGINAQTNWIKHGDPVLLPGVSGSWDDQLVAPGTVLHQDTIYKMWYSGFDGTYMQVGYATSPDGIIWTKNSEPVVKVGVSGTWDDVYAGIPIVHVSDTLYRMWYCGADGSNDRTGYATSSDGINWVKTPQNPVMTLGPSGRWDDAGSDPGPVIYDTAYHMICYGFSYTNDTWYSRAGYATSPDGIQWTKATNPIIDLGTWDTPRVQPNSMVYDELTSKYLLFYGGGGIFNWRVGIASATNISGPWTKTEKVLDVTPGTWESRYVSFPCVLYDSSSKQYKMWYMGGSTMWAGSIGYATTAITGFTEYEKYIPATFNLTQNYPNPFNPNTTIQYAVPHQTFVTLKVFNMLGQEVSILVNEQLRAGAYTAKFDASRLSSGIYFYQLRSGSFVDTKKMLLMK